MVLVKRVWFDNQKIFVELNDGQVIGAPIVLYPNLSKGSPDQRKKYELWENGAWIHWEELDEDLSAEGFLRIEN